MGRWPRLPVHILAVVVWAVAVLNIWSALFAHAPARLELLREYLPLEVLHGSRLLTVVAGFLLLFLGHGVWRHKRRAWAVTVVLLTASIFLHLTKGLDWEEAVGSVAVLAGLLVWRGRFRAASDVPSLRLGLRVLVASVAFACAYGTVGFYFLDRHFHMRFSVTDALVQTLRLFFTFGGAPVPHTHRAEWFLASVYVVGALTLVYGASAALRPVIYHSRTWEHDRRRAAEIVARHGRSPLARMTLFPDKMFFFPPDLDAFVAFGVVGNVAVVLGDPIAPPEEVAGAISSFAAYAEEMDWTPCYFQVLPDHLDAYRGAGYQALKIGEEAIIDLTAFDMKGGAWRDLRNVVNRLTRTGMEARFYEPPITEPAGGQPSGAARSRAVRQLADPARSSTGETARERPLGAGPAPPRALPEPNRRGPAARRSASWRIPRADRQPAGAGAPHSPGGLPPATLGSRASTDLMRELHEISNEWLHHMHGGEKRFSLGWFDPAYLRECDIQTIVSPSGRIEAFANYVTQYRDRVITPDLMRRRADAARDVMDFLFVRAAEHYRAKGFRGLSLGLSPLAGVGAEPGAALPERVMRLMYDHFNAFYSFKGLHAFKDKFHPRWEPRYLIYPSAASLPKVAIAVVRANNPGWLWRRKTH